MKSIAATFVFFTRLPLWQLKAFQVPSKYYSQVINYWPVVGWLTGGLMGSTLLLSSYILPYSVSIVIALLSRLIITGALHEDGLADFLDGFGGGNTKNRILAIMKDSHIGTYGVLGLILYYLLLYTLLLNMNLYIACSVMIVGDPFSKLISAQITRFLPYARTKETSKAQIVYKQSSWQAFVTSLLFGLLPMFFLFNNIFTSAIILPVLMFIYLISLMKKKINGYTGDCCGAMFLLCELSFYLGVIIFTKMLYQ